MAVREKMTRRFRSMLESGETFVQPGVFNAQSAQIAQAAGFKTVVAAGYGVSTTLLGKPDAGLVTLSEAVQLTGYICDAVQIPVLADGDTGYGNAINVMRTVEQFIKAGVGGLFIEDQVSPKRCGHVAGKEVVSIDEAAGKYRAAVRARDQLDPDLVLVARCDARGVAGGTLSDTITRCRAYRDAGADVIFPEALLTLDELEQVVRAVDAPILYNRTGVSPNLSLADMRELRIFLVLNANGAMRVAARAMWDYLHAFAREDAALDARLKGEISAHPLADFHAFVGFPELRKLEDEFLPKLELAQKYQGSIGFTP